MRRWMLGLAVCAAVSAQTPRGLFVAHCAGCHGPGGEGSRGPSLKVSSGRANDVDSLIALLRRGIPGSEMPAISVETVSGPQLRALAEYVLGLRSAGVSVGAGRIGRGAELFRGK